MRIIIKYIIKSMAEKKLRTGLILLAVMLSGALCFASLAITDSMVAVYIKQFTTRSGSAELMVYSGEHATTPYISMAPSKSFEDQVEYIVPMLSASGSYDTGDRIYEDISITGIDLDDYEKMNEIRWVQKLKDVPFEKDKIIISKTTAEKYNLQAGDAMVLKVNGSKKHLMVYGIADKVGLFKGEMTNPLAIVPFSCLSERLQTNKRPTTLYIKGLEGSNLQQLMQTVQAAYPKCEVQEPIPEDELKSMLSSFTTMLLLMTIIVTVMSVFIVYSSFKVIMLEKMPVIGTFRSVGASRKMMNRVLMMESLFYGILGGFAACGLGIGILKALLSYVAALEGIEDSHIVIVPAYLGVAFGLCVIICVASSLFPVLRVSKIPVKDIVLGDTTSKKKHKLWKDIRNLFIAAFSIGAAEIVPEAQQQIVGVISILVGMFAVVGLLPLIIKYTAPIAEKIFAALFGNIGVLAVKNIKGNKSITNSIALITIGVGILFMVNNLAANLSIEVVNAYEKYWKFDVEIYYMDNMNKESARTLLYEEGVSSVYGFCEGGQYFGYDISLSDYDDAVLAAVEGVESIAHGEYLTYDYKDEETKAALLEELSKDRNIILTQTLKRRFHLEEGQILNLKMPQGMRKYKIIGFCDTLMNNGNVAQIGANYLKQDTGIRDYNVLYLKTSEDPDAVLKRLTEKYKNSYLTGATMKEQMLQNKEDNAQIMGILQAFSMLAIIIGIIGVVNNLLISFIERRRSIAVLRSVGMNKPQVIKMIFLEAIYSGITGGFAGIAASWIMMKNMPYAFEAMQMPPIAYFMADGMQLYILAATFITIVASISPALKTSKLNIIEAIKFE